MATFLGAPLAMHLLLAVGLAPYTSIAVNTSGITTDLIDVVFVFNVATLLSNLLPLKHAIGGHILESDGKQLLTLATDATYVEKYRGMTSISSCLYAAYNDDMESAQEYALEVQQGGAHEIKDEVQALLALYLCEQYEAVLRRWEAIVPSTESCEPSAAETDLLFMGIPSDRDQADGLYIDSLCRVGRAEDALVFIASRLNELPDSPLRAIWLNYEAYYAIRYGAGSVDHQASLRSVQDSFDCLPWVSSVRGTLGMALIENEQFDDGLNHLNAADKLGSNPISAPTRYAYRALAHAHQKEPAKAAKNLSRARSCVMEQEAVEVIASRVETLLQKPALPNQV